MIVAVSIEDKGTAHISAKAKVKSVQNFVKLTDSKIDDVLSLKQCKLNLSDKQIVRWHKKCLCLVEFRGDK